MATFQHTALERVGPLGSMAGLAWVYRAVVVTSGSGVRAPG